MEPVGLLILAIFAPLLCGAATLLLPRQQIGLRVAIAAAGPLLALLFLFNQIAVHGFHGVYFVSWMPAFHLDLALQADHLGLFFALLVSGIGLLIVLYARAYFGPDADSLYRFYPMLNLFMTAMLGVALADSFMLLLLFWEMTSISSFLLIGWERDKPHAVQLAMQAFITTAAGGLAMMGGLIMLGIHTDAWTFSALYEARGTLQADALTIASFVLIFVGAAAKSAQFPFHFWLPGAMAAPTPVSAYLHSATMVKAGVYLVGRMWPIFTAVAGFTVWPALIIPLGAITMVYGAFVALQQDDLKKIFAYTTVSQLGLLMTMYGLSAFEYHDQPNLIWDVTQILNHALYKAPLFILAGAIGHVASRKLSELGGFYHRGRTEKIMTIVLLLAGYALAAGPGTVSFTAKEFFFYQIHHAYEASHSLWLLPLYVAGIATGMFNVAIFIRLFLQFTKRQGAEHAHAHDAHGHDNHHHETGLWPAFLWIPGAVIVAFQYIGGVIPYACDFLFAGIDPSVDNYHFHTLLHQHFPMFWDALLHPGVPLGMSIIAIGLGAWLGISTYLRSIYNDPADKLYPGFYAGVTKTLGPRAFGAVQTGHLGWYVYAVSLSLVLLFGWSVRDGGWAFLASGIENASFEPFVNLMPGVLLTILICLTSILMPIVRRRTDRVLVLGTVGFSVTILYYLYKAPDLALTQLSIEIVSLILFLLVLSLLPDEQPQRSRYLPQRIGVSVLVGLVMFWLTLSAATATRPQMPYAYAAMKDGVVERGNYDYLGQFFLRNSHYGDDLLQWGNPVGSGVVERPGLKEYATEHGTELADPDAVAVHKGGGGDNVVNVILVDFRGFDTMGEIAVLGLAALGVWTLLRRRRAWAGPRIGEGDEPPGDVYTEDAIDFSRADLGEPTGQRDGEDQSYEKLEATEGASAR